MDNGGKRPAGDPEVGHREVKYSEDNDRAVIVTQTVYSSKSDPNTTSVDESKEKTCYVSMLGWGVLGACLTFNQYFNITYPSKLTSFDGVNGSAPSALNGTDVRPHAAELGNDFLIPWYIFSVGMLFSSWVVLRTTRLTNLVSNRKDSGIRDRELADKCRDFENTLRNLRSLIRRQRDGVNYNATEDVALSESKSASEVDSLHSINIIIHTSSLDVGFGTREEDRLQFEEHLNSIFAGADEQRPIGYTLHFNPGLELDLSNSYIVTDDVEAANNFFQNQNIEPRLYEVTQTARLCTKKGVMPCGDTSLWLSQSFDYIKIYAMPYTLQFLGIFNSVVGLPVHFGWLNWEKLQDNKTHAQTVAIAIVTGAIGLFFSCAKSNLNWVFKSQEWEKSQSRKAFHARYFTREHRCKEVENHHLCTRWLLRLVGWMISFVQGFFFISGFMNNALAFFGADPAFAAECRKLVFSYWPLLVAEVLSGANYAFLWENTSMRSTDKKFWKMALAKSPAEQSERGRIFRYLAFYNFMDCLQQMISNQSMLANVLKTITTFLTEKGVMTSALSMALYINDDFQWPGLLVLVATALPALLYSVSQYYWTLMKAEEKAKQVSHLVPTIPQSVLSFFACGQNDSGDNSYRLMPGHK